jgi:hypothetical protein
MNPADRSDPVWADIADGLNQIRTLYSEGRIGKEDAADRVARFLDSKGETDFALAALATVKEWRR